MMDEQEMMDEQGRDRYILLDSFSEQDRRIGRDPLANRPGRDPLANRPGRDPLANRPRRDLPANRDPLANRPGRDSLANKPGRDPLANRPRRDPLANRPGYRGPRPSQKKRNRGPNKTLNFKRAQAKVSQAREVQSRLLMKRQYDPDTANAGDHSHHRPSGDPYQQNLYYDSNIAVKLVGGEPISPAPYTQNKDNYASYEHSPPINQTPLLEAARHLLPMVNANSQYVGGASYAPSQSSFTSMDPNSNTDRYPQQYDWQYNSNRSSPSLPGYVPGDVRRPPSLMKESAVLPTPSVPGYVPGDVRRPPSLMKESAVLPTPSVPGYVPDDVRRPPSLMKESAVLPTSSAVFNRLGHPHYSSAQRPTPQPTVNQVPTVQLQRSIIPPLMSRQPGQTVSDPRLVTRRRVDEANPQLAARTPSRQIPSRQVSSRQIPSRQITTRQINSTRRAPFIPRGFRQRRRDWSEASKQKERERKKAQKARNRLKQELAKILEATNTSTPPAQLPTPAIKTNSSIPGPGLLSTPAIKKNTSTLPIPALKKELAAKPQSSIRLRGITPITMPAIRPVNAARTPSHALTTAVSQLASQIQQILSKSSINSLHIDTPDTTSHQVNSQVIVIDADEVKNEDETEYRDHIAKLLYDINDGISSFVAASKQITDSLDSLKNIIEKKQ